MKLVYRLINPLVRSLLASRGHRLLSRNTLVLAYTGRRSGKRYRLPISYAADGNRLLAFTAREGSWWRNFAGGAEVELLVAGSWRRVRASVEAEDEARIAEDLRCFLRAVPRDARVSGVRLQDGAPDADDIRRASRALVVVYFDGRNAP